MNTLIWTYLFNSLLMIFLPIGLAIFLVHSFKVGWRIVIIGAIGFIFTQIGHVSFNYLLTILFQQGTLPVPSTNWLPLFNASILGLSAGIWEELPRWAIFRWWVKDARKWHQGILLGMGWGGIEALLLGGFALWIYIQMVALQNGTLLQQMPTEQAVLIQKQVQSYWSVQPYLSLLGAYERICAITIQIALTIMVLQVFSRNQLFWLGLAIIIHAGIDGAAVYLLQQYGPVISEIFVTIFAIFGLVFIFSQKHSGNKNMLIPEEMNISPEEGILIKPVEETKEILERTRFQKYDDPH